MSKFTRIIKVIVSYSLCKHILRKKNNHRVVFQRWVKNSVTQSLFHAVIFHIENCKTLSKLFRWPPDYKCLYFWKFMQIHCTFSNIVLFPEKLFHHFNSLLIIILRNKVSTYSGTNVVLDFLWRICNFCVVQS